MEFARIMSDDSWLIRWLMQTHPAKLWIIGLLLILTGIALHALSTLLLLGGTGSFELGLFQITETIQQDGMIREAPYNGFNYGLAEPTLGRSALRFLLTCGQLACGLVGASLPLFAMTRLIADAISGTKPPASQDATSEN